MFAEGAGMGDFLWGDCELADLGEHDWGCVI